MTELNRPGGLGIDLSNPLFRPKVNTIVINQPNTQAEGAIRGKLRINETGAQFDEMIVALLKMPDQQRSYFTGKAGTLNRIPENLVCFSKDMVRPDLAAKEPQAVTCASCPRGDAGWEKWRQTKLKEDIPACDAYYHALFVDTVFKLPLQMYVRSKNKKPFEDGMRNIVNTILTMRSQGLNPNIFDISFKLSTKKILTGGLPSYVIQLSDFKAIDPEDRGEFGDIYSEYVTRGAAALAAPEYDTDHGKVINNKTGELIDYVGNEIHL